MFDKEIIEGNIVNKDCFNKILLNRIDQREQGLRRVVRNIKSLIEGKVMNIWMQLNKNKFLKKEV